MGTTADKLNKILESKEAIKQALINKGYSSDEVGDIFSQYGYLIENIPKGEGELSAAFTNANYDYAKDYFLQMVLESYEITKDWTDYSKLSKTSAWFLPQIDAIFSAISYSKIIFFPKILTNPYSNNVFISNNNFLLFVDIEESWSSKVKSFYNGFRNNRNLLRVTGFEIIEGGTYTYCFNGDSSLERLEGKSLGAAKTYSAMFADCLSLKIIDGIVFDYTNIVNKSDADMFYRCTSLEEVRFKENTLKVDFSLSTCTSLSHDSLLSVINACAEVEETKTLTLGETNLSKLTDDEKLIATNKGWTLA